MDTKTQYELTDRNTDKGLAIIQITSGEFKGVEFAFDTVQFAEEADNDQCKVNVEFHVYNTPDDRTCSEIENVVDFHTLIGKILEDLLTDQLESNEPTGQQISDKSDSPKPDTAGGVL